MTQIYRSFNRVILMIDDDKAGKAFGERIAKKCHKYAIGCYRAKYNEYELFPNGAKDVNDMRDGVLLVDDRAIAKCIKNAEIIV
jgi:5S rRNA maturation endonuclease (ribonuclease M5)